MRLLTKNMLEALLPYFDKKATFQKKTVVKNAIGDGEETWNDVEGLVDLKCAIGNKPLHYSRSGEYTDPRCLFLDYDLVEDVPTDYRLMIDGEPYEILQKIESQSEDVAEFSVRRWN